MNVFQGVVVPRSGGLNAMVLEDRCDRVAGDVVAEALQPAADACGAPGRVLVRPTHDDRGDVGLGARAPGTARLRAVVFLGDELPVPPQDGVRCHDANLAFHGQAASLVVVEGNPSGTVGGAEDAVLLTQVVNHVLLLPVDPAGDEQEEEGEWARHQVHGRRVPEGPPGFKTWRWDPERLDSAAGPEVKAFHQRLDPTIFRDRRSAWFSHSTGFSATRDDDTTATPHCSWHRAWCPHQQVASASSRNGPQTCVNSTGVVTRSGRN